jgi:hypothetical protein
MTVKTRPLAEVTHQAIEILSRELGAADALRFINRFRSGYGDYTSERDVLFAGETLDQIISDIKKTRPAKNPSSEGVGPEPGS